MGMDKSGVELLNRPRHTQGCILNGRRRRRRRRSRRMMMMMMMIKVLCRSLDLLWFWDIVQRGIFVGQRFETPFRFYLLDRREY
jgi:hypothetical protein